MFKVHFSQATRTIHHSSLRSVLRPSLHECNALNLYSGIERESRHLVGGASRGRSREVWVGGIRQWENKGEIWQESVRDRRLERRQKDTKGHNV